jgi:hypothetical protein
LFSREESRQYLLATHEARAVIRRSVAVNRRRAQVKTEVSGAAPSRVANAAQSVEFSLIFTRLLQTPSPDDGVLKLECRFNAAGRAE